MNNHIVIWKDENGKYQHGFFSTPEEAEKKRIEVVESKTLTYEFHGDLVASDTAKSE